MLAPARPTGSAAQADLPPSKRAGAEEATASTPENLAREVVTSGNWIDLSYDYRDKALVQRVDLARLEWEITASIRRAVEEDRRRRPATRGRTRVAMVLASLLGMGACTGDDHARVAEAHRSKPPSQAWLDQELCRTRADEAAIMPEPIDLPAIVLAAETRNRVYTVCLRDPGLFGLQFPMASPVGPPDETVARAGLN